jgi:hypothetical protein
MEGTAVMTFRRTASLGLIVTLAFGAGLLTRYLLPGRDAAEKSWHSVNFVSVSPEDWKRNLPVIQARDFAGLKNHAGMMARVRGLVERVGHSERSDTYFLNLDSARSVFTGVIFGSSARAFEKKGIHPKSYEGKTIEIVGQVRDDPVYGLEIFIEDPSQIQTK